MKLVKVKDLDVCDGSTLSTFYVNPDKIIAVKKLNNDTYVVLFVNNFDITINKKDFDLLYEEFYK